MVNLALLQYLSFLKLFCEPESLHACNALCYIRAYNLSLNSKSYTYYRPLELLW